MTKKENNHPSAFSSWIEAMRLHTLPVSVAGVIAGCGCAALYGSFRWVPALVCLVFAVLAQIASNFANEYFDFAKGLDKKGREGFRRGVTEGDIKPGAMLRATIGLILFDSLLGCILLIYGGTWLILIGIAIMLFAIGYSAGPYPLSHHGLGDVAVIIFFGLVPVSITCYLQTGEWDWRSVSLPLSLAVGLMAANVLVVNNYRDMDDDRNAGKFTTAVLFGRSGAALMYLLFGLVADALAFIYLLPYVGCLIAVPCGIYLVLHIILYIQLRKGSGRQLNPVLGKTAMNLLLFSILSTVLMFLA